MYTCKRGDISDFNGIDLLFHYLELSIKKYGKASNNKMNSV